MVRILGRLAPAALITTALCAPLQAHAGFDGQSVNLTYNLLSFTTSSFNANATVGSGVEFVGSGTDSFGQAWQFAIDITDNSINFSWNESTRSGEPNGGNIASGPDSWNFDLTFSGALSPLALTAFSSSGNYSPGTSSLTNLSFPASDTVHVGFSRLDATDSYTISAVPEPETYAMLLAGLGLMGAIARRRRQTT